MSTDWIIKKNYGTGEGYLFSSKPIKEQAKERITFLATERQKKLLMSFCEKSGKNLSEVIRESLSQYFKSKKFDIITEKEEDKNQLKIFE